MKSIVVLFALLAVVSATANSASRGIAVNIKASEKPDAETIETVELYTESYALVIGIDGYANGWPRLSNAINDAKQVAAQLEARNFDVELHTDLNADDLDDVFKRFFIIKGNSPQARLFIWFAGHGATVDGEGYLIPADAPVPTAGPEFKLHSVALRDFGTYMRQAVSKHVYAVFDSCFAGTVFSSQRAMPPAAITRATTFPVRQFLTSGDAAQTVSDDGTFRELFIRAINGDERSDANGDGYVTASELGMFLGDRITNLTASAQTPRHGKLRDKDFDRGDFVFVLPGDGAGTPLIPTAPPADSSVEITFWNSIQDTDNIGELDAYLQQYPRGKFSSLALVKKKELQRRLAAKPKPREVFKVTQFDQDLRATRVANVRQTPFPTAPVVGRLRQGDIVWGLGVTQTRGGQWYKVARDGLELGFVYSPLLTPAQSDDKYLQVATLDLSTIQMPGAVGQAPAEDVAPAPIADASDQVDAQPATADKILEGLVDNLLEEVAEGRENRDAANASEERVEAGAGADGGTAGEQRPDLAATGSAAQATIAAQPDRRADTHTGGEATAWVTASTSVRDGRGAAGESLAVGSGTAGSAGSLQTPDLATTLPTVANNLAEQEGAPNPAAAGAARETPSADTEADTVAAAVAAVVMTSDDAISAATVTGAAAPGADEQVAVNRYGELQEAENAPAPIGQRGIPTPVAATADPPQQGTSITNDATNDATASRRTRPQVARAEGLSEYVRRYMDAAEGGNSQAQLSLGYMYETGEQVGETDIVEAVRWYRQAAANGEVDAQLSLALIYQKGEGLKADPVESANWYRQAANLGNPDAQQTLGYLYESGTGVTEDVAEAARWYERAAQQGKVAAQNNLGRLYQLGVGVARDLDKAIYWYEKAAAQGSDAARANLDALLP